MPTDIIKGVVPLSSDKISRSMPPAHSHDHEDEEHGHDHEHGDHHHHHHHHHHHGLRDLFRSAVRRFRSRKSQDLLEAKLNKFKKSKHAKLLFKTLEINKDDDFSEIIDKVKDSRYGQYLPDDLDISNEEDKKIALQKIESIAHFVILTESKHGESLFEKLGVTDRNDINHVSQQFKSSQHVNIFPENLRIGEDDDKETIIRKIRGIADFLKRMDGSGDKDGIIHRTIQKLSDFADFIKGIDGIDETAHLIGQIVPGVAGAAISLGMLGFFTPFVFIGIVGMTHEYQSVLEELHEMSHDKEHLMDKFSEIASLSIEKMELLNQKLNLGLKFDQEKIKQIRHYKNSDSLFDHQALENIYNYTSLMNRKMMLKIAKRYGWTGAVGMTGMSAGMVAAIVHGVSELEEAGHETISSAAELLESTTVAVGEIVAGSFFLAGQGSMVVYALTRGIQGLKARKDLLEGKDDFLKFVKEIKGDVTEGELGQISEVLKQAQENIDQIFSRQLKHLDAAAIEYSWKTVVGQVLMATGTVLGMSGVALAASIPFLAVGAPMTVLPAIKRILAQEAQKRFSGSTSKNSHAVVEFLDNYDLSKMVLEAETEESDLDDYLVFKDDNLETKYKKVTYKLYQDLDKVNEKLADLKLYSLVQHYVNDKKYKNRDAKRNLESIKNLLKIGKEGHGFGDVYNNFFYFKRSHKKSSKRTTLEENIIDKIKERFTPEREAEILALLSQTDKKEVNKRLIKESMRIIRDLKNLRNPEYQPESDLDEKEIIDLAGEISVKDPQQYATEYRKVVKKFSRQVLTKAKNAAKAMRIGLFDKMISIPSIARFYEENKDILNTKLENQYQVQDINRSNLFEVQSSPRINPQNHKKVTGKRLQFLRNGDIPVNSESKFDFAIDRDKRQYFAIGKIIKMSFLKAKRDLGIRLLSSESQLQYVTLFLIMSIKNQGMNSVSQTILEQDIANYLNLDATINDHNLEQARNLAMGFSRNFQNLCLRKEIYNPSSDSQRQRGLRMKNINPNDIKTILREIFPDSGYDIEENISQILTKLDIDESQFFDIETFQENIYQPQDIDINEETESRKFDSLLAKQIKASSLSINKRLDCDENEIASLSILFVLMSIKNQGMNNVPQEILEQDIADYYYNKYHQEIDREDLLLIKKAASEFSSVFQRRCFDQGIYSGRQDSNNLNNSQLVGFRTKRINPQRLHFMMEDAFRDLGIDMSSEIEEISSYLGVTIDQLLTQEPIAFPSQPLSFDSNLVRNQNFSRVIAF